MTLNIGGVNSLSGGTVIVLSSDSPLDENTFEAPTKVVPETSTIPVRGNSLAHTFPP
jgi:hypothetical protein